MNYLAHIYLSGDDDPLLKIGNFVADSVRGNSFRKLPVGVQNGILMHRHIDTFTDAHPVFRQTKKILRPRFNHYSSVIVDMFYDHMLAKHWHEYHKQALNTYAQDFYRLLKQHNTILPEKTLHILPYMEEGDWLNQYKSMQGLKRILTQMDRRTQGRGNLPSSMKELDDHEQLITDQFKRFFKEAMAFAEEEKRLIQLAN
jgi:acyl carrier protein phosphodiesterase